MLEEVLEMNRLEDITFEQFNNAEFSLSGDNPVIRRRGLSPIIADPSVVTPDDSHDGNWHMICHSIFSLEHYSSDDGYIWTHAGKVVNRAMRGNINRINGEYYIYYEHLQPFVRKMKGLLSGGWISDISLIKSRDLKNYSKPETVLGNDIGYASDERGRAVSNPFLLNRNGTYRLYFSAGQTYLEDCGFCEPTYIGIAESDSPAGPFKAYGSPVISPDKRERWRNLCCGCIKVYKLADSYIGIQNGIYADDGGDSHSAIVLLKSEDGLKFEYERELLTPQVCPECRNPDWMKQFVYASSLSFHDGRLWLYFNARNTADIIRGREHIGLYSAKI